MLPTLQMILACTGCTESVRTCLETCHVDIACSDWSNPGYIHQQLCSNCTPACLSTAHYIIIITITK